MSKFVIAVYADNKYGVLTRVTSMFTRRGFNIDTLTVGETESPAYSRITICLSGDGYAKEQLINQMKKLYNVKKVEVLENEPIKRELMLIKVKNSSETRADILAAVDVYRAKVIDYTAGELCIELTGDPTKIDAFVQLMLPYGVLEMCRTGIVAMERGAGTLLDK
ncbi:MAG: acetolactate synthase small subunit [Clostridia bacterium]|nr:acetolactate synthase small subunit [Clostridia bacterium]